jgi:hypothetical protein
MAGDKSAQGVIVKIKQIMFSRTGYRRTNTRRTYDQSIGCTNCEIRYPELEPWGTCFLLIVGVALEGEGQGGHPSPRDVLEPALKPEKKIIKPNRTVCAA